MLIYDAISPAPRCLRMFVLEKGLRLPAVTVDVMRGENREPAWLAVNPAGQTPALRLDDSTVLAEAVAIAEYLEELHPAPALIGATPQERAQTRQWWRRAELNVTEFIHNAFHYAEGLPRLARHAHACREGIVGVLGHHLHAHRREPWVVEMLLRHHGVVPVQDLAVLLGRLFRKCLRHCLVCRLRTTAQVADRNQRGPDCDQCQDKQEVLCARPRHGIRIHGRHGETSWRGNR